MLNVVLNSIYFMVLGSMCMCSTSTIGTVRPFFTGCTRCTSASRLAFASSTAG